MKLDFIFVVKSCNASSSSFSHKAANEIIHRENLFFYSDAQYVVVHCLNSVVLMFHSSAEACSNACSMDCATHISRQSVKGFELDGIGGLELSIYCMGGCQGVN